MAISYHELAGGSKRLNEVVFAGSHDAGINDGSWFVKTQKHNIILQAIAGVRIFDLRIAATSVSGKVGGVKKAELKTYHGALYESKGSTRHIGNNDQVIDRYGAMPGTKFGGGLSEILSQAQSFVQDMPSEFLLLKFDHCKNWELIAEACQAEADNYLYKGTGNLNTKTLDELKGKIIVLFSPDGLAAIDRNRFNQRSGIHGIRNLYSKDGPGKVYDVDYPGLQYVGKGGTSAFTPLTFAKGKMKENVKKQTARLGAAVGMDPEVIGMMYWTTTGFLGSIKSRNDKMWKAHQEPRMAQLWSNGLEVAVSERLGKDLPLLGMAKGAKIKMFMPNFVMIDFADPQKCKVIADLNKLASTTLTNLYELVTQP